MKLVICHSCLLSCIETSRYPQHPHFYTKKFNFQACPSSKVCIWPKWPAKTISANNEASTKNDRLHKFIKEVVLKNTGNHWEPPCGRKIVKIASHEGRIQPLENTTIIALICLGHAWKFVFKCPNILLGNNYLPVGPRAHWPLQDLYNISLMH